LSRIIGEKARYFSPLLAFLIIQHENGSFKTLPFPPDEEACKKFRRLAINRQWIDQ
jgi:hypothetical protein